MNAQVAPKTTVAALRGNQPNAGGALSFPNLLQNSLAQIKAALPKHLTPERLIRVALTAFRQQPLLAKCEPKSVLASVFVAAQLGLEIGVLGEAYLLPFWSNKRKGYECQLIVGYQGYIKLARNTSTVTSIETHVIYEKDTYKVSYGINPVFEHEPYLDGDPGKPKLVYCLARFKDGGMHIEVMNWNEILKIKARSPSKNREGQIVGPWISDEVEMARKTVVRRAQKYWPKSVEMATAAVYDGGTAKLVQDGGELFAQVEHDDQIIDGEHTEVTADGESSDGDNAAAEPVETPTEPNQPSQSGFADVPELEETASTTRGAPRTRRAAIE